MKPSPTPWRLSIDEFGTYANVIAANNHVVSTFDFDEESGADIETEKANAAMVSAAPDLYGALEMVRDADNDQIKDGFEGIPAMARARIDNALAKAEGREYENSIREDKEP